MGDEEQRPARQVRTTSQRHEVIDYKFSVEIFVRAFTRGDKERHAAARTGFEVGRRKFLLIEVPRYPDTFGQGASDHRISRCALIVEMHPIAAHEQRMCITRRIRYDPLKLVPTQGSLAVAQKLRSEESF